MANREERAMPREIIPDPSGFVAEVSWSESHVQLATLSSNPDQFVAWARQLVATYDERGLPELGDPTRVTERIRLIDGTATGMFWTPDRHEINTLIKVLRRARNSAYGADE